MIPFNKPYSTGSEIEFLKAVIEKRKFSGNGFYTQLCHNFFTEKYNFEKCLLTTSCTDALEMCAILLNIQSGDEVIVPSYTFVSSALAFVRQGATIVFADSSKNNPNIDPESIESKITDKTKAIVIVHYAGFACEMDRIVSIANKHNLYIVEDAAHAIDSNYISPKTNKKSILGSIGDLSTFSFHETKNIQCGEGGLLVINNKKLIHRSEIIWEKGTNRAEFFRGEVNKYQWVDYGSSFLPSEYIAAALYAQLINLEKIQQRRIEIWDIYNDGLKDLKNIAIHKIENYSTNNAHMFYLICNSIDERESLIAWMKIKGVNLVFHYLSLHKSNFCEKYNKESYISELPMSDFYSDRLVRLPLYYELSNEEVNQIVTLIKEYYYNR